MSDVSKVGFFHPPLNPTGGGTVYVRPSGAGEEDEGRCAPDLLTQGSDVQSVLNGWFADGAGTHNATDAATGAVRTILELHRETVVRFEDDAQPICNECGHDWDGNGVPGCPTVRAIVHAAQSRGLAWRWES